MYYPYEYEEEFANINSLKELSILISDNINYYQQTAQLLTAYDYDNKY